MGVKLNQRRLEQDPGPGQQSPHPHHHHHHHNTHTQYKNIQIQLVVFVKRNVTPTKVDSKIENNFITETKITTS